MRRECKQEPTYFHVTPSCQSTQSYTGPGSLYFFSRDPSSSDWHCRSSFCSFSIWGEKMKDVSEPDMRIITASRGMSLQAGPLGLEFVLWIWPEKAWDERGQTPLFCDRPQRRLLCVLGPTSFLFALSKREKCAKISDLVRSLLNQIPAGNIY